MAHLQLQQSTIEGVARSIVERRLIRTLVDAGALVIVTGGGGIPVARTPKGLLKGVEGVIDKDFASALLAINLRADVFMISTAVERVALRWGKPEQRWIDTMTLAEAKERLAEGTHFAPGSMAPKIEACIEFLEHTGGEAIISSPDVSRSSRCTSSISLVSGRI